MSTISSVKKLSALMKPTLALLSLLLILPAVARGERGDARLAPSARAPEPGLWRNLIVVPERKLMFCFIEKLGCKSFSTLFCELAGLAHCRQKPFYRNRPRVTTSLGLSCGACS